jgi:hypothetical protein
LLQQYGEFCLALQPQRLVVTHLHEFGRPPEEYWEDRHFRQARRWMKRNAAQISVESACMGESVVL